MFFVFMGMLVGVLMCMPVGVHMFVFMFPFHNKPSFLLMFVEKIMGMYVRMGSLPVVMDMLMDKINPQ